MADLFQNNHDGACAAAIAVRAYLAAHSGIESSWSKEQQRYTAEPQIARWHNCREQGYVVTMRHRVAYVQINIAFYEHRNSDSICAIGWVGKPTLNPPTLADIPPGVFESKWDIAHTEMQPEPMADWIFDTLTTFWDREITCNPKVDASTSSASAMIATSPR